MASSKPVSLAYKTFEPRQCKEKSNPIIFLHGLGASKEHWTDIPQKVADATHRKVYAVDARNHGDSEWTEEFNFDLNALDLIHFIEQIAADKVTIVGHSMGGVTCMKTALKMPSKIEKIVIEDIGIVLPKEILGIIKLFFSLYQEALSNIPAGLTRENAEKYLEAFVNERIPDVVKQSMRKGENRNFDLLKQNPDGSLRPRSNLKAIKKSLENEDTLVSDYKGVYNGPVCFICGEKSIFPVYKDAESIKKFFPNAQFAEIEGATHDVHTEAPNLYTEALLKFLKE